MITQAQERAAMLTVACWMPCPYDIASHIVAEQSKLRGITSKVLHLHAGFRVTISVLVSVVSEQSQLRDNQSSVHLPAGAVASCMEPAWV